jgi:hypothetical protein
MSATDTTPTASATAAATGSLVEQVSFQRIFDGLAQKGITLSSAEQARFEEIARDEIRKQNGGQLIGMNIGGAAVNLIEILFSFIQRLFGSSSGTPELSIAGLTGHLTNAASGATNTGKQYVINTITANIYERMRAEGGNLAQAAPYVTGLTTGPGYAPDMTDSLMRQLTAAQNIPDGTSSSLNPTLPVQVADASGGAGSGLPRRPLTGQALGA